MELEKFSRRQEEFVALIAADFYKMMVLRPAWDAEASFERMKAKTPLLKGVSWQEVFDAAMGFEKFKNS